MVGVDTMAIGGSDIAKDLLRVRIVFVRLNIFIIFIFSKWKK
jgi:hypothetical protein